MNRERGLARTALLADHGYCSHIHTLSGLHVNTLS
jgi:hypothetical protein